MSSDQVQQFIEQATQSLQTGQFQQALELAEQAIGLDENTSDGWVLKGVALSQLNRPSEATDAFRQAIMHSPYNAKAYFNLAVHNYGQGEKIQAEEMARETIRIDPRHAGAKELLNRIETERQPSVQTPSSTYVGDPLSGPMDPDPAASQSPAASVPAATPSNDVLKPVETPSQPQMPYTPPMAAPTPTGYYRGGYETQDIHSLQFVGNMGKNWDMIGWGLIAVNLVLFVISTFAQIGMYQKMFSDPGSMSGMNPYANFSRPSPDGGCWARGCAWTAR